MSGTTSLCLQQQYHNITHNPLVGGLLYSFQAGTLNPQNAFRTAALTAGSEFPNPVVLDASARVPQMFYADGLIRLIMSDKNGVAQFDYDNVPVIGSSGGGGSIDTTDVTRLYGTGDMKIRYGTGAITGFVRGNGRAIGNTFATGDMEFADPTAQALFQYFWNQDPNLAVSGGRGANALADWTANKSIATPDFRGRVIGGLDGMGASRILRLAGSQWDTLGLAADGLETRPILENQMPVHGHTVNVSSVSVNVSGSVNVSSVNVSGSYSGSASVTVPANTGTGPFAYNSPAGGFGGASQSGSGFGFVQAGSHNVSIPSIGASGSSSGSFSGSGTGSGSFSGTGTGTGSGTAADKGGGQAFNITQPTRLVTVYFRL